MTVVGDLCRKQCPSPRYHESMILVSGLPSSPIPLLQLAKGPRDSGRCIAHGSAPSGARPFHVRSQYRLLDVEAVGPLVLGLPGR